MKGQDRGAREQEMPAVRTTIVGGRPPGSGKGLGEIPRGIEVLVKKAAVDEEFQALLLERRSAAAGEIGLALDPAEALMLDSVPGEQLAAIIRRTRVSPRLRPAFLGRTAAVMLAALGVATTLGCGEDSQVKGIRPDTPEPERAAVEEQTQPTRPQEVQPTQGTRPPPAEELGAQPAVPEEHPPVGVAGLMAAPQEDSAQEPKPPEDHITRGIRPDRPPEPDEEE